MTAAGTSNGVANQCEALDRPDHMIHINTERHVNLHITFLYGSRPLSGITRESGFSFHDNPCKLDTPITGRRNIYPKEKKTLKISIIKT